MVFPPPLNQCYLECQRGQCSGLLLFLIYIDGITSIPLSDSSMLLYADDLLLYSASQASSTFFAPQSFQLYTAVHSMLVYADDLSPLQCQSSAKQRTFFAPLFSAALPPTFGGIHPNETTTFYKRLASCLAAKWGHPYCFGCAAA